MKQGKADIFLGSNLVTSDQGDEKKVVSSTETGSKVSIVMPAYNAEKYIRSAIESVLSQTYPYFELIVVNDGSKDRTAEIIKSFNDPRIVFNDLPENKGVSYARNLALSVAKGKWIAFIDSDDMWKPDRLEYLLGLMSKYEYGKYFIADDLILSYETNNGKFIPFGSEIRIWLPEIYRKFGSNNVIEINYKDFFYIAFQPIIPLEVIEENKLRFPEGLSLAEDLYFYAKLFKLGLKMLLTKESFYFYRLTQGSLTDSGLSDFIGKVRNFEGTLETDKEFDNGDKELFKKYFEARIKNIKESGPKRNFMRDGFAGFISTLSEQPNSFLKYVLAHLSNPYKWMCYLRLRVVAQRNGGIKRL
ncbi:glycosyltransferase family 2 protein [Caldisericum sp.]|uniref:glycosyltransferase family 2 protein n=1 Tax=Caldisericum sp. TaxID=2499687 RepID=UPI003D14C1E3